MGAITQVRSRGESSDFSSGQSSEQQLRESQKMEAIGRLVGGVAHDFNNLLTGMVLCSELLLAGLGKKSRLRHYAEEIRAAGAQGVGLIQQLLAVARQRVVEPRLLSLNQVISEVHQLMTRLIGEDVELVTELADDLPNVTMDPAQAQQIVLNLILNGRDAMPNGGQITLRTRSCPTNLGRKGLRDPCVELAVSDTGCGMDPETQRRVFEPFFTTKKSGKGNGLGLTTVNNIVTRVGGTIVVESEVGKGTKVLIYLPQAPQDSEIPAPEVHEVCNPTNQVLGKKPANQRKGNSV